MKLLLDTNVLLRWLNEPGQLTDEARIAIANPHNFVFVSPISMVEIAIKERLGKLTLKEPLEPKLDEWRFCELPFTLTHAAAMKILPPLHKDPFDRMLVAQSRADQLTFVTRDTLLGQYNVSLLAA